MTRAWSGGSRAELCQKVGVNGAGASAPLANSNTFWAVPQSHRLQFLAMTLHVFILASLWPVITSSPVLIVLVVTTALVLILSLINHPQQASKEEKIIPVPAQSGNDHLLTHQICNLSKPRHQTLSNFPPIKKTGTMRRNPAPVHAQIAPLAAPNAVLPRGLDPKDHAWADLMARLSHDLRTPLNAVIGFSDLMQQEAYGPLGSPRYQEYARHIQDCGLELLKSAEDTLAMTSALNNKPSGEPAHKPIALKPLILNAWEFVATQAQERKITLQIDVAPEIEVLGEAQALRQVLLNLMCEAKNYTENNSQLFVRAISDNHHVEIEISTKSSTRPFLTDTLPLCVARTLLSLHGTTLMVLSDDRNGWRAKTILELVGQHDFFKTPLRSEPNTQTKPSLSTEITVEDMAA